jgi:hypothetical protein
LNEFDPTVVDPLLVAAEWGRIQLDLESLLTRYYKSVRPADNVSDERLPLMFEELEGGKRFRARLPQPLNEPTKAIVIEALRLPAQLFSNDARVIASAAPAWTANLRSEFEKDGRPNVGKIKSAVERIILFDPDLKQAAAALRATLSTLPVALPRSGDRCIVLTEWQQFEAGRNLRRYWRLRFTLAKNPQIDMYDFETRVDIGERSSSQEWSEIAEVSNSYRLSEYFQVRDLSEEHKKSETELQGSGVMVYGSQHVGPLVEMKKPFLRMLDRISLLVEIDKALFHAVYRELCTPPGVEGSAEDGAPAPVAPAAPGA